MRSRVAVLLTVAVGVASGYWIFNPPLRQLSEDVQRTAEAKRAAATATAPTPTPGGGTVPTAGSPPRAPTP